MTAPSTATTQTDERSSIEAAAPIAHLWLLYSAGRVRHEQRLLGHDEAITIGRAPLGDGVLILPDDQKLSRSHARVTFHRDHGLQLADLGSKNHVFLNGNSQAMAASHCVLSDGDLIRMGGSLLLVRSSCAPMRWLAQDSDTLRDRLRGSSMVMTRLRSELAQVATQDATVLLLGASGTGKELAAQAIHDLSRRHGKFVAVNSTTLSSALAESQLFGHTKGAFTGASEPHRGYFREAEGGTLFLDEVGDLPIDLQPKLLRALQEKKIRPVGATADIAVNVRVIAATHVDLHDATAGGRFRADLRERLAVLPIHLPRLCQRREDILPLFAYFMCKDDPDRLHLPLDLVQRLLRHDWSGNVRELFNVCQRLTAFCAPALDLNNIPDTLLFPLRPTEPYEVAPPKHQIDLSTMSREQFVEHLDAHQWNISAAASSLCVDKGRLYRLLDHYQLKRPTGHKP